MLSFNYNLHPYFPNTMFQEICTVLKVVNSIVVMWLLPGEMRRITNKIIWTRFPRKSRMGPALKHLPSADELRDLKVFYIMGSHAHDFMHDTKDPAPELQDFSLYGEMPSLIREDEYPASQFTAPANIFGGVVPKLRRLTLNNIAISADSPLLMADLTHLDLGRYCTSGCPRSFSLPVLLDVLRRMPYLQSLQAGDILTEPTDASSLETYLDRIPKVHLPDLKFLRIESPWILNYRGLLRQLSLQNESLRLFMGTSVQSFEDMDEPLLPSCIASVDSQSLPIRALKIESRDPRQFVISGWRTPEDDLSDPPFFGSLFSADIQLLGSSNTEGISSLLSQLPTHMVETLCIDWSSYKGDNPIDWSAILQSMDRLQRIIIMKFSFDHVSEVLLNTLAVPANDVSGGPSLLCPQLTALSFPWMKDSQSPEKASAFFRVLENTVQTRLEHGSKLEELVVGKEQLLCGHDAGLKVLRERAGRKCSDGK